MVRVENLSRSTEEFQIPKTRVTLLQATPFLFSESVFQFTVRGANHEAGLLQKKYVPYFHPAGVCSANCARIYSVLKFLLGRVRRVVRVNVLTRLVTRLFVFTSRYCSANFAYIYSVSKLLHRKVRRVFREEVLIGFRHNYLGFPSSVCSANFAYIYSVSKLLHRKVRRVFRERVFKGLSLYFPIVSFRDCSANCAMFLFSTKVWRLICEMAEPATHRLQVFCPMRVPATHRLQVFCPMLGGYSGIIYNKSAMLNNAA